ncbi:MAG: Dabb family protein [Actinomycetota bacterium]|nr:Dabb family protein [Actinomycetota bacterium]
MFRHVVMVSFTEEVTEDQKQALRDGLATMPEQIPEVRAYRFGDDAGLNDDNYDFVVVADFEDRDGFLTYRDHPAHQKLVVDLLRPIVARRASVQHEWRTALPSDLPG